ncbi:btb (poz) domain-containing 2a-related [Anaeramoeba flamelloides]|uniref:Btb (Poz) domain-containing 2a-related n=1 Tax=Anaeramoeba flamelloides TaxID=1746091 RepID=A0ABQ8XVX6_9EUKA|nr:btb (poz) domain-containing 2a-related [Anaeramoeba flamelloides]
MKGIYLRNFGEIIKPLQGSQLLSDVVFYVGKQEQEFYGHRFLFALTSDFWRKKLYPFGWRTSQQVLLKFRIPDFSPSVFQCGIDFVYQRRVHVTTDNVEGILRFASFFEMEDLILLCLKFVIPKLNLHNALECLDKMLQYDNEFLQGEIMCHIEENSRQYLSQKFCFNKLKEDTVRMILQSKKIEINEIGLFRRLLERAKNLVKIKNSNQVNQKLSNPKQLRDEIKNLIPLINLDLIGPSGLMEIHQTGVIDPSELFKILIKHEQRLLIEEEKRNEQLQAKNELLKKEIEEKNESNQSLQLNYEYDGFYSESSSDYPSDVEIIPIGEIEEFQNTPTFILNNSNNNNNNSSSSSNSPIETINGNNKETYNNINLSKHQADNSPNQKNRSLRELFPRNNNEDNSIAQSTNSKKNQIQFQVKKEKEKEGEIMNNGERGKEIHSYNDNKMKIENVNNKSNKKNANKKKYQKNVYIDESESNDEESENYNFSQQNENETEREKERNLEREQNPIRSKKNKPHEHDKTKLTLRNKRKVGKRNGVKTGGKERESNSYSGKKSDLEPQPNSSSDSDLDLESGPEIKKKPKSKKKKSDLEYHSEFKPVPNHVSESKTESESESELESGTQSESISDYNPLSKGKKRKTPLQQGKPKGKKSNKQSLGDQGLESKGGENGTGKEKINHPITRRSQIRKRELYTSENKRDNSKIYLTKVLLLTSEQQNACINDIKKSICLNQQNLKLDLINSHTPTYQEINSYDCIFVYTGINTPFNSPELIGDVLSKFVDDGGGVVICSYRALENDEENNHQSEIMGKFATNYLPFEKGALATKETHKLGELHMPKHPILENVESFSGGTFSYRIQTQMIKLDTKNSKQTEQENSHLNNQQILLIASWDDGNPLIALRKNSPEHGIVIALNLYPISNKHSRPKKNKFWDSKTDGKRIISNSILFVSRENNIKLKN